MEDFYLVEMDTEDGIKTYLNEGDGSSPWTFTKHINFAKKYYSLDDVKDAVNRCKRNLVLDNQILETAKIVKYVFTKEEVENVNIEYMYKTN